MTYDEYRKTACEWCAKGFAFATNHNCTALPPKEWLFGKECGVS